MNIKDIAKLAGVSHGTVSNVLNGRPGVSPEKVRLVLETVERSNFVLDQSAKNLKKSFSTSVSVLLPNLTDPNFAQVFTGVERTLSDAGFSVHFFVTGNNPIKEKRILSEVHQNRTAGVIVVPCSPEVSDPYDRLVRSGVKLVFVEREHVTKNYNFVGFNNYDLIQTATLDLWAKGHREIVLVTGPENYSSERQCIEAFRATLEKRGQTVRPDQVRVTVMDRESSFREAMDFLGGGRRIDAVIASSTPVMEGVMKAYELTASLLDSEPEFVTLSEDSWTSNDSNQPVRYRRHSIALGEKAAELLLENIANKQFHSPRRISLEGGIVPATRTSFAPSGPGPGGPIRLLMLEGTHVSAIESLLPAFHAQTGIRVKIEAKSYSEMYSAVLHGCLEDTADVVQVDVPWLPDFARRSLLLDLTDRIQAQPDSIRDFIPGLIDVHSRQENRYFAFPYLYGAQLLFYRKDLFENESLKNEYRIQEGVELRPPLNWLEYNAVSRFFTRAYNPHSPVPFGTTLGAGVFSGAVCEFLPRLWGFGGDTFLPSGKVNLDSLESIWALENYRESFLYAPPGSSEFWWNEQVKSFMKGDAAMMVLFVAHATQLSRTDDSSVVGKIGYAAVPGSTSLLGGWSLGIAANSKKPDEAFEFLRWITGPEMSIPATILGGTTASIRLYKSSELVSIYPWLPKAIESFSTSRKRTMPASYLNSGISEWDFEKILGQGVHDCIIGKMSAEEALSLAAKRLSGRLSEGLPKQK